MKNRVHKAQIANCKLSTVLITKIKNSIQPMWLTKTSRFLIRFAENSCDWFSFISADISCKSFLCSKIVSVAVFYFITEIYRCWMSSNLSYATTPISLTLLKKKTRLIHDKNKILQKQGWYMTFYFFVFVRYASKNYTHFNQLSLYCS